MKRWKKNLYARMMAAWLSLILCGCNSVVKNAPGTEATTKASETEESLEYTYDWEKGELVGGGTDWRDLDINAGTTIKNEYLGEDVKDPKAALEKVATDHKSLWNAPGDPAFYILDYHSTRAQDIKDFQILGMDSDEETIIYAYETTYYGTGTSGLSGSEKRSGNAGTRRHVNWGEDTGNTETNAADGENKRAVETGDAPQTNLEVYCLMRYNTRTREYQVLDMRTGEISPQGAVTEEGMGYREKNIRYQAGQQRLFTNRARDDKGRYGPKGQEIYYVMYDAQALIISSDGQLLQSLDMNSIIRSKVKDHTIDVRKYEDQAKTPVYSILRSFTDDSGDIYTMIRMGTEDMADWEGDIYLLTYTPITTDSIELVSVKQNADEQEQFWQENPDISWAEIEEACPSVYTTFQVTGVEQALQLYAVEIKIPFGTFVNEEYFSPFREMAGDLGEAMFAAQESGKSKSPAEAWRESYEKRTGFQWTKSLELTGGGSTEQEEQQEEKQEDLPPGVISSAVSADTPIYNRVMDAVKVPVPLTGKNLQTIKDSSANIVYYLYDTNEVNRSNSSVSIKNWDADTVKIQDEDVSKRTLKRKIQVEDGEEDGESDEEWEYATQDTEIHMTIQVSNSKLQDFKAEPYDTSYNMIHVDGTGVGFYSTTEADEQGSVDSTQASIPAVRENGAEQFYNFDIGDTSYNLQVLDREKNQSDLHINAISQGKHALYAIQNYGGPQGENHIWIRSIPYSMVITPVNQIKKSGIIEKSDQAEGSEETYDKINSSTIFQINGSMAREEAEDSYRFTTLQSGILKYDMKNQVTVVISPYQYYTSWKNQDGSYTAVGFQTDSEAADFHDIMKAKIYRVTEDPVYKMIFTLKERLRVDLELREEFLKQPDGWKEVYKKYGIDVDADPDSEINQKLIDYAKRIVKINDDYQTALQDFWKIVDFAPTEEEKKEWESRFFYCTTASEVESVINDAIEVRDKKREKENAAESTPAETVTGIYDDGWLNKVIISQQKALKKQQEAFARRERADATEEWQWQDKMQALADAAKARRALWN